MFQDFRSRNASLFINMADQQYRYSTFLGIFKNSCTTLTNLGNTTRRRFYQLGKNRLNGIYNQQIRLDVLCLYEDLLQIGLTQDQAILAFRRQTVRTHFQLTITFFPRNVQNLQIMQLEDSLQNQGRFSDSRFTANQDQRPFHQTTAQHTVQFLVFHIQPVFLFRRNVAQQYRTRLSSLAQSRRNRPFSRRCFFGHYFFYIGIPFSAVRTLSQPFRRIGTTIRTNINRLRLCHLPLY